jgi:phosphoenolpyruvate carboxylase
MRCDKGVGELIASVVSGIDSAREMLELVVGLGCVMAVAGEAALAACSRTSMEITTTDTTGRKTITHRIFMNKTPSYLWHGIITQVLESRYAVFEVRSRDDKGSTVLSCL